jgi:hypothetical protein
MSIETRTAKSIEHTYRRDAVQRRPARKCPSPGASLTKEWKSPDHPKHSCEQTVTVLAGRGNLPFRPMATATAATINGRLTSIRDVQ